MFAGKLSCSFLRGCPIIPHTSAEEIIRSHERERERETTLVAWRFQMIQNTNTSGLNNESVDSGVEQSTGLQIIMQISDVCSA